MRVNNFRKESDPATVTQGRQSYWVVMGSRYLQAPVFYLLYLTARDSRYVCVVVGSSYTLKIVTSLPLVTSSK